MFVLRLIVALCLAALLAGCGGRSRDPVPRAQLDRVAVDGYADARYWGDEPSDALAATFAESWRQERAALGLADAERRFPDAHYLAISGGGQDGAFGAGVLCGWTARGDRPAFKVVTGISTGALIAPMAFLGSAYDEPLKEVYTTVEEKDLVKYQGLLALFRSDAAYSTAPLSKLAAKYFTAELLDAVAAEHRKGRRLLIGTTHLDAGRPVIWDAGKIAASGRADRVELFRKIVLASAAIPGAFPPVYLDVVAPDGKRYDEMHVDGGVTREAFLLPSDLKFYELRDASGVERASHLHVIRNSRYGPEYANVTPRVGPIAGRAVSTLIKAQAVGDLMGLYHEARENDMAFRVTSIPDGWTAEHKSMFDKGYMTKLFDLGFALGKDGTAWRARPAFDRAATRPTTAPGEDASVPE